MHIAKISTESGMQTVHLPKDFQFNVSEVVLKHFGNGVLLLPKKNDAWGLMQQALTEFESNFTIQREEISEQARDEIV